MAIVFGLESDAVSRLTRTWKDVGQFTAALLALQGAFSPEDDYKFYQDHLKTIHGAAIPFLG